MTRILSEDWLKRISIRRLGCRWVVGRDNDDSRQLVHPGVKALGQVCMLNGKWTATDGSDNCSLRQAQRNIERQVAEAIQADLSQLDEAIAKEGATTVISHLTLRAIEAGMEDAIVEGLKIGLEECEAQSPSKIMTGKDVPKGCVAAFEYGQAQFQVARPRVPRSVISRLKYCWNKDRKDVKAGVELPFQENAGYSSVSEILAACTRDAAQYVIHARMPGLSAGGAR